MKKKKKVKKVKLGKYPRCGTLNKICYPDENMARAGLKALWRSDPTVSANDMNVYQCYFCNKWHLGHKAKYEEYKRTHGIVA